MYCMFMNVLCLCLWIHVGQLFACLYTVLLYYICAQADTYTCVWYIHFLLFFGLFSLLLSRVREVGERERKQKFENVNINYKSKNKFNSRKFCDV